MLMKRSVESPCKLITNGIMYQHDDDDDGWKYSSYQGQTI